jgi:protein disulfide-isomerase
MRLLSPLLLLGAAAVGRVAAAAAADNDDGPPPTTFNGVEVPPMMELTPENFVDEVESNKYMLIKHYSPYCPHCIDFAPTFQTLYEYYYTSHPEGTDESFSKFYDFKFASVNCVVYFDMCQQHKIRSYPSTILYVDGQIVETVKGVKAMEVLSELVEKSLVEAKPGSRPKSLNLPRPGDKTTSDKKGDAEGAAADKTPAASNAAATTAASLTPDISKSALTPPPPPIAPKKRGPMNEAGASEPLTHDDFDTRVTRADEPWFIKFYAPWCHHCQALAPKWVQMAKAMKGRLNVGEINCDKEQALCKKLGVRAYPSIQFFDGAASVEYRGLRGLGDFVKYAEDGLALTTEVPEVDLAGLRALEDKADVVFVYLHDHATTSEDFAAVQKLPLHLVGRARIVTSRDGAVAERFQVTTFPRLLVVREGRPTYYDALTPREMRDVPTLLEWVRASWLPLVPELTAMTAQEILDGKVVVLSVLNRDHSDIFASSLKEIKAAASEWMDRQAVDFQRERQRLRDAKQARIDDAEARGDQRAARNAKNARVDMTKSPRREVAFAWIDGVFWQRWVKATYGVDVRDGERVIVNDEDNYRFWDTTAAGAPIPVSKARISDVLEQILADPRGAIRPKLTVSTVWKLVYDVRDFWTYHPFLALVGSAASVWAVVQYFKRRQARYGGGGAGAGKAGVEEALAGLGIKRAEAGIGGGSDGKND